MKDRILGVIAGVVTAWAVILCLEFLSSALYPLPPGTNPLDTEALKALMPHLPLGAFLLVLLGWVLGVSFGGAVANRFGGGGALPGYIVGAIILGGAVLNMVVLPHPVWFMVVAVLALLAAIQATARFTTRAAGALNP